MAAKQRKSVAAKCVPKRTVVQDFFHPQLDSEIHPTRAVEDFLHASLIGSHSNNNELVYPATAVFFEYLQDPEDFKKSTCDFFNKEGFKLLSISETDERQILYSKRPTLASHPDIPWDLLKDLYQKKRDLAQAFVDASTQWDRVYSETENLLGVFQLIADQQTTATAAPEKISTGKKRRRVAKA